MMMIRWPTAWAFPRSSWTADVVATVLDGKFARAGIAPVEAVVMTARRTSCGGTSKIPGVAVPGRVTTVSLLAGIAAVGIGCFEFVRNGSHAPMQKAPCA